MKNFDLIETLLWEDGHYFLLDPHLERLKKSTQYFGFPYQESFISGALESSSSDFNLLKKYRTRLLLGRTGKLDISSEILDANNTVPAKVAFSEKKTDKGDVFLCHKTTNRALYDEELEKYRTMGFFDVIFSNQDGEITEGAITNIVIQDGEDHWTPPLSCGVLPGVFREYLLKAQVFPIKEKALRKEDLYKANKIFLINSVRKILPVVLDPQK